jgi:hypothetical protein
VQAGFRKAAVHVDRSGRNVTIVIPASSACAAQPGDERKLIGAVKQLAPFVVRVSVLVSGSGQSLSSYIATRCGSSGVPSGSGRVVYNRTGRGVVTSPVFEVHSRRWTVDYRNSGRFLAIFVLKNGKVQREAITANGRTTGSKTFTGPGKFSLRISGSGTWTVRVRDGA